MFATPASICSYKGKSGRTASPQLKKARDFIVVNLCSEWFGVIHSILDWKWPLEVLTKPPAWSRTTASTRSGQLGLFWLSHGNLQGQRLGILARTYYYHLTAITFCPTNPQVLAFQVHLHRTCWLHFFYFGFKFSRNGIQLLPGCLVILLYIFAKSSSRLSASGRF